MERELRTLLIGQIVVEIQEKRQAADHLRSQLLALVAPASALVEWLKKPEGKIPFLLPVAEIGYMASREQDLRLVVSRLQNQLFELGVRL